MRGDLIRVGVNCEYLEGQFESSWTVRDEDTVSVSAPSLPVILHPDDPGLHPRYEAEAGQEEHRAASVQHLTVFSLI